MPENPRKAIAISADVTKAIGRPFMLSGMSASSSLSLIPAMRTRARVNPTPPVNPFQALSIKL
jgi:hypothetical protein